MIRSFVDICIVKDMEAILILLNTKLVSINHTSLMWISPSWLTSLRLPTCGSR